MSICAIAALVATSRHGSPRPRPRRRHSPRGGGSGSARRSCWATTATGTIPRITSSPPPRCPSRAGSPRRRRSAHIWASSSGSIPPRRLGHRRGRPTRAAGPFRREGHRREPARCGPAGRRGAAREAPGLPDRSALPRAAGDPGDRLPLLTGEQGGRLRHTAVLDGHSHLIARALERLRKDFDRPLRMPRASTTISRRSPR